jgi:uncharacterized protein
VIDLHAPLGEDELEELDNLLLNRRGHEDEEDDPDRDEGVFEIAGLDGFLTAIVSSPDVILPSQWLPVLWGEAEPVWESAADCERSIGLILRHMNGIAGTLMECPDEFEPIVYERTVDGTTHTIVDEWCTGYMLAQSLVSESWEAAAPDSLGMLGPIALFGTEEGWEVLEA